MVDLYEQDGIIPHIQVHDELNISVENEEEALKIKHKMENCVELNLPSVVDHALADNWGDAK
jgi:DNA polymerase I-like protein with 3'-5' exonuclease and polymerase domains